MSLRSTVGLAGALLAGAAIACTSVSPSTLGSGQSRTYATGRLPVGSAVSCGSHGVRATARVPPPGGSAWRSSDGAYGDATVSVHSLLDGSVVVHCA
jgi:hypothetical protein